MLNGIKNKNPQYLAGFFRSDKNIFENIFENINLNPDKSQWKYQSYLDDRYSSCYKMCIRFSQQHYNIFYGDMKSVYGWVW